MHQIFAPDIPPQASVEYLQALCKSQEPFYVFTYETFVPLHPNSEDMIQNFEAMVQISAAELRTQIYFDLVNFYMYTKQYRLAREAVNECRLNLNITKSEYQSSNRGAKDFRFCHLNENELEGYLMACGVSSQQNSLMERFNMSQILQYKVDC